MKMSEEMAVRLHRMMWSDMQRELGDNPRDEDRKDFKNGWIIKNFPGELVMHNCFLCEYAKAPWAHSERCKYCPIRWPGDTCCPPEGGVHYETSPISDILALPAKNEKLTGLETECLANNKETIAEWYYRCREELLSKASGLPASTAIDDHIKAIQEKVIDELAKASGLPAANTVTDHISAIQEKAIEEYFAKTPGAKLATMDVDQAFKQYADEQKAPIFHALAEASGLSAGNESVKAHISLIRATAKQNGRAERSSEVFRELAKTSGLSAGKWCISDHVKAIQEKAQEPMQTLRKTSMQLADKLDRYKDALSKESNLDRNRPVDDHIKKIVEDSFNEGRDYERERIMDKVGEMLNK